MKKTMLTIAAGLLMAAFTGCVKGDKGDAGPAGTNGTNGTNGNANVVASTATLTPANWGFNTSSVSYCNISDNDITADIVATGTVEVFFTNSSGSWAAMPYTFFSNPSYTLSYGYSLDNVLINLQYTDGSNNPPSSLELKIVAISSAQRKAHPATNWKNYNECMAALSAPAL